MDETTARNNIYTLRFIISKGQKTHRFTVYTADKHKHKMIDLYYFVLCCTNTSGVCGS